MNLLKRKSGFKLDDFIPDINNGIHLNYRQRIICIYSLPDKKDLFFDLVITTKVYLFFRTSDATPFFTLLLDPYDINWNNFHDLYEKQKDKSRIHFSHVKSYKPTILKSLVEKFVNSVDTKKLKKVLLNFCGL